MQKDSRNEIWLLSFDVGSYEVGYGVPDIEAYSMMLQDPNSFRLRTIHLDMPGVGANHEYSTLQQSPF